MKVSLVQQAAQQALDQARKLNEESRTGEAARTAEFSNKVQGAVSSLMETGAAADTAVSNLVSGQNVDMHNTMIRLGEVDLEMRFVVQLRNRAIAAYEEVMRLQV